jgi:hypothetical protein
VGVDHFQPLLAPGRLQPGLGATPRQLRVLPGPQGPGCGPGEVALKGLPESSAWERPSCLARISKRRFNLWAGTAWSFHTAILHTRAKRKRCLRHPFWWRWGELNPRPKVSTAGLYARSPRFRCPPGLARGRAARGEPPCASPGVRGRGPRLAGFVSPLPVSPRQGYRARSRSLSRETRKQACWPLWFRGFLRSRPFGRTYEATRTSARNPAFDDPRRDRSPPCALAGLGPATLSVSG